MITALTLDGTPVPVAGDETVPLRGEGGHLCVDGMHAEGPGVCACCWLAIMACLFVVVVRACCCDAWGIPGAGACV